MAGYREAFRDKIALYRSGFCLWRDERLNESGCWQTTRPTDWRQKPRGPRSLFRRGFQEQGICGFGMSVVVARPRLLGSHKSVLLLSRSEFIRLDSPESSSPRQKRSRPVTESQTIYSPLSFCYLPDLPGGFRIPNIFASWIGPCTPNVTRRSRRCILHINKIAINSKNNFSFFFILFQINNFHRLSRNIFLSSHTVKNIIAEE